jgi:ribosomal protein S18 acetylase RimI-like enzyme
MATINEWRGDPADLNMLADVLHATVHDGGSVSFVLPFPKEDALAFWRDRVLPGVRAGTRRVLVARIDQRIVGTVQIDIGTPPNQPHRAEVLKMLVHPDARRQGLARTLMTALEDIARASGRSLLTLDTVTGGKAEGLYRSLGYVTVGVIPGYALPPAGAEFESTTIMYKVLSS